jgi:hypothetical protein
MYVGPVLLCRANSSHCVDTPSQTAVEAVSNSVSSSPAGAVAILPSAVLSILSFFGVADCRRDTSRDIAAGCLDMLMPSNYAEQSAKLRPALVQALGRQHSHVFDGPSAPILSRIVQPFPASAFAEEAAGGPADLNPLLPFGSTSPTLDHGIFERATVYRPSPCLNC